MAWCGWLGGWVVRFLDLRTSLKLRIWSRVPESQFHPFVGSQTTREIEIKAK